MFIAVNRIVVEAGKGEGLIQRFAASEGLKGQPGVLGFELLRRTWQGRNAETGEQADTNEEFLVMTRWESQRHFQDWTQSDAFKKAHGHHGKGHAKAEGSNHMQGAASAKGQAEGPQAAACAQDEAKGQACANREAKGGMVRAQASGYDVVLVKHVVSETVQA